MKKLSKVMTEAYMHNPARWSNEIKSWVNVKKVYLYPSNETKEELRKVV